MPRKKRKKIILGSKTGRSISTKEEEEEEEEYKTQTLFIIDSLSYFFSSCF
jgi:predicted oxidoreductase